MRLGDKEEYLGRYSEVCTFCKHFKGLGKCEAFDEIPEEIWFGENKHIEPYEGDKGIQFVKRRMKYE